VLSLWRVRRKKQKACFFFFFFFFLQIAVTLGLDTKGDSNVTGNWRFIACIDIYNLRATSTADPIRRARARRKCSLARRVRRREKLLHKCALNPVKYIYN
jgi:hypothetical protein